MKQHLYSYILPLVVLLTACNLSETASEPTIQLKPVTLDARVKIIAGQTVYVPIYSYIYSWGRSRTMDLTATLSVRNTDLTQPIIIASVNYYDTSGKLVRKYLEQPVELRPLAATHFIVDQEDNSGGLGAAFIVEWVTQKEVSTPVIEAVMINASGNQGISLLSHGRVIKSRTNSSKPTPPT
jgi:hypothetical protein